MSEQDKRKVLQMELTCFIWSELELLEMRRPVYSQCRVGGYEMLYAVQDIAEHYSPVAYSSSEEWLDILYVNCAKIAQAMHKFMHDNKCVPTWSELGVEL